MLNYVKQKPYMNLVPYIWDLRLKENIHSETAVLFKATCFIENDGELTYHDPTKQIYELT